MADQLNWELLDRYFAGECDDADAEFVRQQLRQDPGAAALLEEFTARATAVPTNERAAAVWMRLEGEVTDQLTDQPHPTVAPTTRRLPTLGVQSKRSWRWLGVVAASVLVIGGWLVTRIATHLGESRSNTVRYTTTAGNVRTVTLRDGSRVTLAPGTTIVMRETFGEDDRIVNVTGHASFHVASSTGHPFIVRTGAVTTRVLGTTFDVRHYASDADVRVAVLSGKVSAGARQSITLTRGDVARFDDSTATVMFGGDMQEYDDWTHGRLSFTRAPVREILTTLGYWYGLEFRVADTTLAQSHLTVVFDNDSKPLMLQTLKTLLGVQMHINGSVITLLRDPSVKPAPVRRGIDSTFAMNREVGR